MKLNIIYIFVPLILKGRKKHILFGPKKCHMITSFNIQYSYGFPLKGLHFHTPPSLFKKGSCHKKFEYIKICTSCD